VRRNAGSPVALLAAAGVGFGVAWLLPTGKSESTDAPQDRGIRVMSSILDALNYAGLILSLFPPRSAGARKGDSPEDPR
jgi:hypothetical protein